MPIAVNCSQCGRSYQLRDELAGKKAKCKCGGTILIPAAPTVPLAPIRIDAERALAEAKLVDLQVTGDTARGAMALEFMGRETKRPLEFRRIDGGWLMHLSGQIAGNPLLPQGLGS